MILDAFPLLLIRQENCVFCHFLKIYTNLKDFFVLTECNVFQKCLQNII